MESVILAFKIYGLAIVISMLVALMIKGIVVMLERLGAPRAKAPAAATPVAPGISGEHIAAIAAAAHAVLGAHRIVHVEDRARGMSWTFEGRAAHHGSHQIPRRPIR